MRRRLATFGNGVVAIGSKELRGRMRGPRAFIALTFYLALLAGFTVMISLLSAQAAASQAAFGSGNPYVSSQVGQAVFTTLLLLQVLLIVFLAPAATSGAISLEREKQTLDLLAATPVSTLGIVVGKLTSAIAFVGVLILASVPLTAVVFVYGGVAPEDILRGYVVLLVTALGFGSVGIFLSTVTRRTQSATVLTYLAVLVLTVGTGFTWFFWNQMATPQQVLPGVMRDAPADFPDGEEGGSDGTASSEAGPTIPEPPEALLWLNPVVAAADVICGMDVNPYSTACGLISEVTGKTPGTTNAIPMPAVQPVKPIVIVDDTTGRAGLGGVAVVGNANVVAAPDELTSTTTRDSFWPQAALAWLVTSAVLVLLAVQLVSPTRRWHVLRRRPRRETRP